MHKQDIYCQKIHNLKIPVNTWVLLLKYVSLSNILTSISDLNCYSNLRFIVESSSESSFMTSVPRSDSTRVLASLFTTTVPLSLLLRVPEKKLNHL